jgi:hypothetical protein
MASSLETLSTYLDVVDLIPQLYDEEDENFPVVTPQKIRDIIWKNDSQLRAQLKNYYGADLTSTPRLGTPHPSRGYTGTAQLSGSDGVVDMTVSDDSGVETQVYKFTFTSATAYDCTSDLTGVQGSGNTSTTFTTTDTWLSVNKDLWSGTFATGDIWYVPVYNCEGMTTHMSSLLAAVYILNTIYTEEVPDASATATKYETIYNRLIRALQKGVIFLEKDLTSRNLDPIQIDYEIDNYGRDVTNYQDDEWNRRNVN